MQLELAAKALLMSLVIIVDDGSFASFVHLDRVRKAFPQKQEEKSLVDQVATQLGMTDDQVQAIMKAKMNPDPWWTPKMNFLHVFKAFDVYMKGPYKEHSKLLAMHLILLCRQYKFDPAVIISVIKAESSFRTNAESGVGAIGLMQIMPGTADYMAKKIGLKIYQEKSDLNNPFINLTLGVSYLAYLRRQFKSPDQYLAAYNMGPTIVRRMVAKNEFYVGEGVENYITQIQGDVLSLRRSLASNSAYQIKY